MNNKITLRLQEILKDKLSGLSEMLRLTKEQSIAIKDEEIEVLDSLIDNKNNLISKINLLDSEFKNALEDNHIEENILRDIKTQINETLKEIKEIDDENSRNLASAINDMKLNLKEVRCGQRAMKNYGNSDPYQSFVSQGGTLFIDQDS